jgi:hypothetical protein
MYVALEYVRKDSEETRGSQFDAVSVERMHRVGAIERGSRNARIAIYMHELLFLHEPFLPFPEACWGFRLLELFV